MNLKIAVICIILVFSMVFSACAFTKDNGVTNTPNENENSNDKNPSNDGTDTFCYVRESEEEWLQFGLEAYESGKQVEDMSEFFSDTSNIIYLTLYDDIFYLHREKSNTVAASLFKFIYENYGSSALMDVYKRVEYKNAYLRSLGIEQAYPQLQEVETLFASMRVSSNDQYKYIMKFDGVTYYFKDLSGAPSISLYRQLVFYTYTGLNKMIDFIRAGDMSEGLNIDREFDFYMTLEGGASRTHFESGNMYINNYSETLHEAVHAIGVGSKHTENIWLSEGICQYFGKMLGFNPQIAQSHFQELNAVKSGQIDQYIAQGNKDALRMKYVYDKYVSIFGDITNIDDLNLGIYTDVLALYDIENGISETINEIYQQINGKLPVFVGGDMSYIQVASFANYLATVYTPKTLLEAYRTDDIEGVFGKSYETLKAEWLEYLNELIIEK